MTAAAGRRYIGAVPAPALPRLAEATWPEARRLARDRRVVVLLPLGAVEQHGPHLPLLVDWLGAEELARRVAPHLRRAGFRPLLAPSLPYGASPLADGWPGTVGVSVATLRRVIVEVVGALARQGFRRIVLTNYQADPGQLRAMAQARRALRRTRGLTLLFAGFTPDPGAPMLTPRVTRMLRSPRPEREWHSGELETAMMLDAAPHLVRKTVARRLPAAWVDWRAGLQAGKTFRGMAPRGAGYFGSPAAARASTGRRAMSLRAGLIAAELIAALRRR
ncbi:MAG TPA: creatininase family protein [Terriglobales bacterium]|nr:creatininase family protein [Terriglobales bacterium]